MDSMKDVAAPAVATGQEGEEPMTLRRHHECCIGVMALCYEHVPDELKEAIRQGVAAARELGFECDPNNLGTGLPLCMNQ